MALKTDFNKLVADLTTNQRNALLITLLKDKGLNLVASATGLEFDVMKNSETKVIQLQNWLLEKQELNKTVQKTVIFSSVDKVELEERDEVNVHTTEVFNNTKVLETVE